MTEKPSKSVRIKFLVNAEITALQVVESKFGLLSSVSLEKKVYLCVSKSGMVEKVAVWRI